MAGTSFGWLVRLLRFVRQASRQAGVRRTNGNNLYNSMRCGWVERQAAGRRACIFLVLYKPSCPNAAVQRAVVVPPVFLTRAKKTGIYRDKLCSRSRSQVHPPFLLVARRAGPAPIGWYGLRQSVRRSTTTYIVEGMGASILFIARSHGPALALATPGGVGIAVRATRAWRNGRRNGLEALSAPRETADAELPKLGETSRRQSRAKPGNGKV
jgi:hypothetical protein